MDNSIGLTVTQYASLASCISILRKYTGMSFSEIRIRITGNDRVLCYPYTDRLGLKKIIRCYDELKQSGISAQLSELDNRPTTIEFLQTLDKTYDEISDEIDAEV